MKYLVKILDLNAKLRSYYSSNKIRNLSKFDLKPISYLIVFIPLDFNLKSIGVS